MKNAIVFLVFAAGAFAQSVTVTIGPHNGLSIVNTTDQDVQAIELYLMYQGQPIAHVVELNTQTAKPIVGALDTTVLYPPIPKPYRDALLTITNLAVGFSNGTMQGWSGWLSSHELLRDAAVLGLPVPVSHDSNDGNWDGFLPLFSRDPALLKLIYLPEPAFIPGCAAITETNEGWNGYGYGLPAVAYSPGGVEAIGTAACNSACPYHPNQPINATMTISATCAPGALLMDATAYAMTGYEASKPPISNALMGAYATGYVAPWPGGQYPYVEYLCTWSAPLVGGSWAGGSC